jgi:hypothetical protein
MMILLRVLLFIAAPITALFVSRDALNFGVMQTLIAVILIAAFCLAVAFLEAATASWTAPHRIAAAGREMR